MPQRSVSANLKTRRAIVKEAREWIGTPWVHHQSIKGVGCDCVGLLIGVGKKIGFLDESFAFENYERIPRNDTLTINLEKAGLVLGVTHKIGSILVFKKRGIVSHVGIVSSDTKFIHSYDKDNIGVVETYLDKMIPFIHRVYEVPWQKES